MYYEICQLPPPAIDAAMRVMRAQRCHFAVVIFHAVISLLSLLLLLCFTVNTVNTVIIYRFCYYIIFIVLLSRYYCHHGY